MREALAARARRKPNASQLVTTYYDTPDLALRQHHSSLRVRDQNGRFVQAVKTDGAGDALRRGEWEGPIADASPDLDAPATARHLPKKIRRADLRPLFTTRVDRTVFDIRPRRSVEIEAAMDMGEIEAETGDGSEPIRELELEMKSGDPGALYDLALELLDVAPLEIGTSSKSERGYGLVESERQTPQARRQPAIRLDSRHSAEESLQIIGRACLGHLLRNVPAALAGDAEGIHQMRVAARRLRSLLSAAKPLLPDGQRRWASEELRRLADALGDARNWDSFVSSLLPAARGDVAEQSELELLAIAAGHHRKRAHEHAQASIRSRFYARSVLRLLRWFEYRSWRDEASSDQIALIQGPVGKAAARLLDRCRRQVRRRSRRFSRLGPAERHKLRIALKTLRYNLAFFASLYPARPVENLTARLKPLQDMLGHANDVRVARTLVAELQNPGSAEIATLARAGGFLLGWHQHAVDDSERGIKKALARVRSAPAVWR